MGGIRRKHSSKSNNKSSSSSNASGSLSGPPVDKRKVAPQPLQQSDVEAQNANSNNSKTDQQQGPGNGEAGSGAVRRKTNSSYAKKKCRILAHMWDPRIKGCCFVPAKSERCCAITLQTGTRFNTVGVCTIAVLFEVYYLFGLGFMEYYFAATTDIYNYTLLCGGASVTYGHTSCLPFFAARSFFDFLLIAMCIVGYVSAPCGKINNNMLEQRHCQATGFFIGLAVALIFQTTALLYDFIWWSGALPAACVAYATDVVGASSPWKEMFCESDATYQAILGLGRILFICYILYVMLITLAYRGWLIKLQMKHFKGFKGGDWSSSDEEEEPELELEPEPEPEENAEDELQKALDDMMMAEPADEVEEAEEGHSQKDIDDAWMEAEDDEGNVYYSNYLTGESAWSLPTSHLEEVQGMFDDVIDQSEDRQDNIETVYKRFRTGEGKDGLIDYVEFCKVLQVDANDQVKKLFDLFDEDHSGKLTIKEFVVGVCNFTGKDTAKKVEFAFKVFDEDNDGVIDVEELCQILRAIHMARDEKEVQRKAKLIMAKSDTNNDGVMSFDEFIAISKKFPNILFPAFNLSNQLGQKLGFT